MFLHLRWYGIDTEEYRLKTVNVSLPPEDIERLEIAKREYGIPYGEFFSRAIFYLRAGLWKRYKEWVDRETYDERQPKYRGYVIREQLDERIEEVLQRSEFDSEIQFEKIRPGKRCRICFRMRTGDLKFLNDLSKGEIHLDNCLHYLIKKTIILHRKKEGGYSKWVKRLIKGYRPHWPITFAVRDLDCQKMDEFVEKYEKKYSEELTRSEIVVLAYHLFKRMGIHRQEIARSWEKNEGKNRGEIKKISVSFSYEGKNYWEKHKPSPTDLRAALHSLLGSNKFWRIVGIDSTRKRASHKLQKSRHDLTDDITEDLDFLLN